MMHIYARTMSTGTSTLRVGVIGASGYSGGELLRLLLPDPGIRVEVVTAHAQAGRPLGEVHPFLAGRLPLTLTAFAPKATEGLDAVFVALPSGEAMQVVPSLLGKVGCIIDLGGDLRLPTAELYERYYHRPHTAPQLLGQAVYGLPELNRKRLCGATLIANPGCYPTGAILALLPALREKLVRTDGIIVNSWSGVSGAGRTAAVELSFGEMNENARAYRVGDHQHVPEIAMALSQAAGASVTVSFVPHLLPVTRGIHTTVHAELRDEVPVGALRALYEAYYRDEPFVRFGAGEPELRSVQYTNYCDGAVHVDPHTGHLVVTTVIDNLVKGAAGQAVQNLNLVFGRPEHALLQ
jgi:N-acetyl-gamma-glutamyl-phosphate reductase